MNVKSKEKKENSIIELTVESQRRIQQGLQDVYKKQVKNIAIPDFVKGKHRAERMYGGVFLGGTP